MCNVHITCHKLTFSQIYHLRLCIGIIVLRVDVSLPVAVYCFLLCDYPHMVHLHSVSLA